MTHGPRLSLSAWCLAFVLVPAAPAFAHPSGNEARSVSECDVLPGTALGGARGDCLRCIGRAHYHYHSDLPRRDRCHRENRGPRPPGTAARRRRH